MSDPGCPRETGAPHVEVTPEMIAAGADELREKCFGQDLKIIAEDVFLAMVSAMSSEQRLGLFAKITQR